MAKQQPDMPKRIVLIRTMGGVMLILFGISFAFFYESLFQPYKIIWVFPLFGGLVTYKSKQYPIRKKHTSGGFSGSSGWCDDMPDVLAHDFIKACTANDTLERDEWGRGENMSRVNTKKYIAKIPFAIKACLLVAFLAGAIYFVVLMAMNARDLYYFQHNIDTGNVGKTLHYLEWSEDGKLLTDQTFTIDLTPEQQSEISKYLKQMTEGGHLTFKRHELSNQVRIQFTNPGSPYFYRDAYSPDIRLFLRSENYEEGFEKLLAFVQQTKQEKISSIE